MLMTIIIRFALTPFPLRLSRFSYSHPSVQVGEIMSAPLSVIVEKSLAPTLQRGCRGASIPHINVLGSTSLPTRSSNSLLRRSGEI